MTIKHFTLAAGAGPTGLALIMPGAAPAAQDEEHARQP